MMALRSMQKAKKTCTKCHWPKHSPTLYQLRLDKQQPPSSIPTKGSIKRRGGRKRKGPDPNPSRKRCFSIVIEKSG